MMVWASSKNWPLLLYARPGFLRYVDRYHLDIGKGSLRAGVATARWNLRVQA